jgi:hypothetical protein
VVPGFWARPEWLYPVVILLVGAFIGAFTLHALKRAGAATLVAALVVGIRLLMIGAFGGADAALSAQSHILIALVLIGMDRVYALRLRHADAPITRILASLGGAAMIFTLGFAYIAANMVYPRINGETVPGMIIFGVLTALAAGGVGATLGGWIGALNRDAALASADATQATRQALRIGLALLIIVVSFVAWFAATATPPEVWIGG